MQYDRALDVYFTLKHSKIWFSVSRFYVSLWLADYIMILRQKKFKLISLLTFAPIDKFYCPWQNPKLNHKSSTSHPSVSL